MKALALRAAQVVPARQEADASIVEFASEEIAADVRVLRSDRRNRSRTYGVRLATLNFDVSGRLIGVLPGGNVTDLGGLAVARGSIGSAHLTIAQPRNEDYEAVYLEIRSDRLLLRVDAPCPSAKTPARFGGARTIGAAIAASALCAGLALMSLIPEPSLGAPEHAVAGSTIHLSYTTQGLGRRDFSARFDDGTPIAGGALDAASGQIALALAPSSARRRIVVALTQHAPLGARTAVASFALEPPRAAIARVPLARVISLAAHRDQSEGAESVLVSYLATGESGTLALIASSGAVLQSQPFGHVGTGRLTVPDAYRGAPLVAKLSVHRGTTNAYASVAIPAANAQAAPADIATAPEAVTPIEQPLARTAFEGVVGLEGRAIAGRPLRVRVMPQLRSVHVELQDSSGGSIVERDVAPGATHFTLPLPPTQSAQTYYLVTRYTRNSGEETVVRTIRAAAR